MQSTLDSFNNNGTTETIPPDSMVLVSITRDFNVSWYDRDWFFHSQDIVHIRRDLADLLFKRDIARGVQLHE